MSSTEASYAKGANFDNNELDAILTPDEEKLHAAARQNNGKFRFILAFLRLTQNFCNAPLLGYYRYRKKHFCM